MRVVECGERISQTTLFATCIHQQAESVPFYQRHNVMSDENLHPVEDIPDTAFTTNSRRMATIFHKQKQENFVLSVARWGYRSSGKKKKPNLNKSR